MADRLTLRFSKLTEHAVAPVSIHGASEDAGMDLFAAEEAVIEPSQWTSVGTGICLEIPAGYEGQVRPRSGLARRHGVTLINSPGTIDPGYRGEIRVTLVNFGTTPYRVCKGDRIAQLIIGRYASVTWQLAESLDESARGEGGFGSTGR